MIFGVGIDLVEIGRIENVLKKWEEKFLCRIYSAEEIRYCNGQARPAVHFAARFAVKEAFLKAIGLGMGGGVRFRDIETTHDEMGKPMLKLAGGASSFLEAREIRAAHLTISHTSAHATAVVILER
ncbi:MAG: holo-ACP synthase [Deltaproteobacteria bacterium]|nr:holo-ACP synthase [Deltaproteobacteria bacterium]